MIDTIFRGVNLAAKIPVKKLKFPLYAELKHDGVRAIIHVDKDKEVKMFTRSGKQINFSWLAETFKSFPPGIYDSEIVLFNHINGKLLYTRPALAGAVNSSFKGDFKPFFHNDVYCFIFDYIDAASYSKRSFNKRLHKRLITLYEKIYAQYGLIWANMDDLIKFNIAHNEHKKAIFVEGIIVHDIAEVDELFELVSSRGFEGLMLKDLDSFYKIGRSRSWLKYKSEKITNLTCTGVINGKGKYHGMVGALSCEGIVEDSFIKVNVGSGLTDCDRAEDSSVYTGKKITVKYNCVLDKSLFLPIFVSIEN